MFRRGRRLRDTAIIRDLVRENELSVKDFILPIFVVEGENIKREISSLKGNYHWSVDRQCSVVGFCLFVCLSVLLHYMVVYGSLFL